MTDIDGSKEPGPNFGLIAVVSSLAIFIVLQIVAAARAQWALDYPLDDTYIHLAMAAQIANGGYGVNAGEYASAASSPLYPYLLTLSPGTGLQRLLPIFWNVVALCLAMWLWGRALVWAGYSGVQGWVLAVTVPLFAGGVTIAYTGMEHALQAAAALAVVYGLARFLVEDRLNVLLFLGLLFSPLIRFEGLALDTMALIVIFAHRRYVAGVAGAIVAFLPVGIFVYYLMSLGLDPLPNSVQAKLVSYDDADMSLISRFVGTLFINMVKFGGLTISGAAATLLFITALTATSQSRLLTVFGYLLALTGIAALTYFSLDLDTYQQYVSGAVAFVLFGGIILLMLLVQALRYEEDPSPLNWLAIAVAVAGMGHVVLAQTGWMERYEHYIIQATLLAAAIVAGFAARWRRLSGLLVIFALFASGQFYTRQLVLHGSYGSRAISAQQGQMALFAKEYLDRNVAVNDLGWVSWGNRNYVLDLYGLANKEARETRIYTPTPGWAGPLAVEHDVSVIMVYDSWMSEALDPDWIPLGKLVLQNPRGFLGGYEVSFYARNEEEAQYARSALDKWIPTLKKDTCFIPLEALQCPA